METRVFPFHPKGCLVRLHKQCVLAWALPLEQRGELPKELMQEPQLIL